MKIVIEVSGGMIANVQVPMELVDCAIEIKDFDCECYAEDELSTDPETGEQFKKIIAVPEVLLD